MGKIGSREKMIINSHDSYSCPMYDDISQGGLALEARFHDDIYIEHFGRYINGF